jgi:hypothetical protein
MTNSATVEFDPGQTSLEGLVGVIRETGYGAELPAPPDLAAEAESAEALRHEAGLGVLRRKTLFSAGGVLAMLMALPRRPRNTAWTIR